MGEKAVFLDRDNTIIEDPGYLTDPDAVKLMPGADLALKSLAQAGYKLVVVTNQSGVARGMLTEETLDEIHAEMRRRLAAASVHLDGVYYCPYHPEGTVEEYARESDLRNPRPGMLIKAAGQLGIDLSGSWMIGDAPRDVEAGQRAGCRTIRIRARVGHAGEPEEDEPVQADFTVRNVVDAVRVVLREDAVAGAAASDAPAVRKPPPAATPPRPRLEEANPPRVTVAGVSAVAAQALAPAALLAALWFLLFDPAAVKGLGWAVVALALQVAALTCWLTRRRR